MATEFCQRCKQSHPGRVCDYDEKGECAETLDAGETDERNDSVRESTSERKASGQMQEDRTHK
jgi:hypothetical protein